MITKTFTVFIFILISISTKANDFKSFEDAFQNFCSFKKIDQLITPDFQKEVNEKKAYLELTKGAYIIQFSKYNASNGDDVYVFNYFADTSYYHAGIHIGCYKHIDDKWVEVTDEVMPMLNFKDFYGPDNAPPKSYMNTVQFRYELHKNDYMKMIIEPNWMEQDSKKERIFEQKKYSALQLKWNKNTGKFDIDKWLR